MTLLVVAVLFGALAVVLQASPGTGETRTADDGQGPTAPSGRVRTPPNDARTGGAVGDDHHRQAPPDEAHRAAERRDVTAEPGTGDRVFRG